MHGLPILESYDVTDARISYPDGADGVLCETVFRGRLALRYTGGRVVTVDVEVDTQSTEAAQLGKDVYELVVQGSAAASTLVLYDFVRLKRAGANEDLVVGMSR